MRSRRYWARVKQASGRHIKPNAPEQLVDDLTCSMPFLLLLPLPPLLRRRFIFPHVMDGRPMLIDYLLSGVVTLSIFFYLVFALLRPELF